MPGVTVKRIDDMESIEGFGRFRFHRARAALGVSSFGMSIIDMPANATEYPEHDHSGEVAGPQPGQEEVYLALRGSGVLEAEGERHPLDEDHVVRVAPETKRKILAGERGLRLLALGGVPGKAYEPPATG